MENELVKKILGRKMDFSDPKIKTAYALNLCTVSVSQIIDYDDANILEQEYEAILNNLNIEKMPKDEALLKILKQLLDTITFFRIQEGDKLFIDKEYQYKMKNAIWKAVPKFGLIVAGGNPYSMMISLASQVGIGYMNYRKTKAENALAYEKEMWQLHRSAIEQFNGLRRELFDTAWRLADTYEFPDNYRLTERQVRQYDDILMDSDPYRRYERLDTIKDAFIAYPPFWYFIGNTANEIARLEVFGESDQFKELARDYYEIFIQSYADCNLLRENQIASSCALEYISLLDEKEDMVKISELLKIAIEMSGNANDILQLCTFGYLKIGDSENAERLLGILVNEGYNAIVNAQLLSRLYVQKYLIDSKAVAPKYARLCSRIDEEYLYPLPVITDNTEKEFDAISKSFMDRQKEILLKKYGISINLFQEKYRILFNRCVPAPGGKDYTDSYFDGSTTSFEARKMDGQVIKEKHALEEYADDLVKADYPYNYLLIFNKMYDEACDLNCTQGQEAALLKSLSDGILSNREKIVDIRNKADDRGRFSRETYYDLLDINFDSFSGDFFTLLIMLANAYLSTKTNIVSMNDAETNLRNFCLKQGFESPDDLYETVDDIKEDTTPAMYLGIELIDDGETASYVDENRKRISQRIKAYYRDILNNSSDSKMIFEGSEEFDRYFIMLDIPNNNKRNIRRKTIAILDDQTDSDNDLLFTIEGISRIRKRKLKSTVKYDDIIVNVQKQGKELIIQSTYDNDSINIDKLISLIESLTTNGFLQQNEVINPLDLLQDLIKKK